MSKHRRKNPPVLLVHGPWMRSYRGETDGVYGGKWKHPEKDNPKKWHERFTFLPIHGECRGSPFNYNKESDAFSRINIRNLGARRGEKVAHGVTVIYTAPHPELNDARVIVGFMCDATVLQESGYYLDPEKRRREYSIIADSVDCKVIPAAMRKPFLKKSRTKRRRPGQHPFFYASLRNPRLARQLLRFVKTQRAKPSGPSAQNMHNSGAGWSSDPVHRLMVEQAAMSAVRSCYRRPWKIKDVSHENNGWDLEMYKPGTRHLVEVKGVSGHEIAAELTPNEFKQMKAHAAGTRHGRFVVAIVTRALNYPKVHLFKHDGRHWRSGEYVLKIKIVRAARLSKHLHKSA